MSRRAAAWVLGVMLAVVLAQGAWLQGRAAPPVTQIELHPSRLVAFLAEIRHTDPETHDSLVLNLQRLRDHQATGQDVLPEEAIVAEQLLRRLQAQGALPAQPGSALPRMGP